MGGTSRSPLVVVEGPDPNVRSTTDETVSPRLWLATQRKQEHFLSSMVSLQTSNGTETITISILFRRLESTVFQPPGIGNTPTLTSSKRSRNRNTPCTTEARVVRQTAQRFFLVGHVPSCSCAVESVLWESCPVTRSPSCARVHRQTGKPLPPPTCVFVHVSVWLDGPSRRHSFKRRQPRNGSASADAFTSPKVQRRTLSVPRPTPCTPPLHPRGPGDVRASHMHHCSKCRFITVRKTLKILFLLLLGWGRKLMFFVCVSIKHTKGCLQRVLSRVRSGYLFSASLRACEIACNAHDRRFGEGRRERGQALTPNRIT